MINLCGCEPTLIISLEVFYLKLKQLWTHLHSRWFNKRLLYNESGCRFKSSASALKLRYHFPMDHTSRFCSYISSFQVQGTSVKLYCTAIAIPCVCSFPYLIFMLIFCTLDIPHLYIWFLMYLALHRLISYLSYVYCLTSFVYLKSQSFVLINFFICTL